MILDDDIEVKSQVTNRSKLYESFREQRELSDNNQAEWLFCFKIKYKDAGIDHTSVWIPRKQSTEAEFKQFVNTIHEIFWSYNYEIIP